MKKKFETSKVIIAYILLLTTIVTIFTLYITLKSYDLTALGYLIPAIFAELATGTAFYYKKAEAENKIKLAQSLDKMEKKLNKKITINELDLSDKVEETEEFDPFKEAE